MHVSALHRAPPLSATKKKRRRPGEGGVYKRPNGTYAATLELGADVNGKRRRKFVYGKTETDVLNQLRILRRQLADHGDLPTADMTVGKWLTYWLDNIAFPRLKPGTMQSYRTAVTCYLIPSLGKRPLSRLTTAHIRQMHVYVRETLGRSSTTAHNAHRILSVALNDAVREGRVGRNVAALVPAPRKAVSKRRELDWAEGKAVLTTAAKDERLAARWLAAFLLGARQGELLGLRWAFVDLESGMVDLAWALQPIRYAHGCTPKGQDPTCGKIPRACPAKYLPIPDGFEYEWLDEQRNLCLLRPKSRESRRVVPLSDWLWEALKLHRQNWTPNPHDLLWATDDGRPINPKADWTAWKALLTAAEVRDVKLHEARHSTATWLANEGVPENVIVSLLGHSDVIVNRSYQHLSPTVGRAALNLIPERLGLN